MIKRDKPDYHNTPASASRPDYHYVAAEVGAPLVSVLMPYYNTGPVFAETVLSLQRMSVPSWECIIVDDGSTDADSIAQLDHFARVEPRIRVIRQTNAGPGVARNTAYANARGRYLMQLDSDDLVEPTFAEKAIWFLETQPQFGACGAWVVGFGTREYAWSRGFNEYERFLRENAVNPIAVMRRETWDAAGGYDVNANFGHEDWDFWLNMASGGYWGYTLPEYLTWYRTTDGSRLSAIERDRARSQRFSQWLREKHKGLETSFPHPRFVPSVEQPQARLSFEIPVQNRLAKPDSVKRVLCIYPWMEIGGADKFNLDMIQWLGEQNYQFTIVTTENHANPWLAEFARLTPDIFCLDRFLNRADYPRFIDYLIESRQIDAVLISHSQFGYLLTPYLRARHPTVALLDYNHLEEERWNDGGYPAWSVRVGRQFDLNVTCTNHLKEWMVGRGADQECIDTVYCCLDTKRWRQEEYDIAAIRRTLQIDVDTQIILFVGRMVDQKRPMHVAKVIKALSDKQERFVAVLVGAGPELGALQSYIAHNRLHGKVRILGAQTSDRVREIMGASDILLLPSEREGLALVLYEAMAMGIVPVAANVGGHAELVTSDCGFLISHRDHELDEIDEYATAISTLLQDPEKRRTMSECGQARIRQHFDIRLMAEGMDRAFKRAEALARTRSHPADLALGQFTAHVAVEQARLLELSQSLWSERERMMGRGIRRAQVSFRRWILPYDTRRYAVWKRVRRAVEEVVFGPARVLRHSLRATAKPVVESLHAAPSALRLPAAAPDAAHADASDRSTQ